MAKHVFRFPIVAMLLALLSVSIPVLADNLESGLRSTRIWPRCHIELLGIQQQLSVTLS